ncbi:putative oxidoreductase NAD-/NADP-dependent [Roseivivax marinus]|uniref:Putative oxidoreductase NAD-/NADP-dependent n=1 Tax=Roseivivax marinus TaxID=1379903 RepID=W4HHD8_9RHOB|nr:SDR family NAD(P)-dependent oxidoreductase [Roseivivax marinus]ETW11823.1 putative oxidoreductase NAD-/NADP-dependent [Roseivivax marinus]
MTEINTRTLLITGCSSGIGLDAARTLSERGWRVFATARKTEDVERLSGEGLEALRLDYADPDSIAAAVAEIAERTGGRLDAVFHNGAYAIPGPLEDVPPAAMRAIFESNFLGWHDLTTRVIPMMRAHGGGRIVMNSSVLGLIATKWRGAYCATKFAVEGWSDALRMEMRGTGIEISVIEPGPIDTAFRKNAIAAFEKWVDWEKSARADQYRESLLTQLYEGSGGGYPASDVTKKLIHALEAPRPRVRYFVTPHTHVAGALKRVMPARLLDRLLDRA